MLSIAERHKYILDSLNKDGFGRVTGVSNERGVTMGTMRMEIHLLVGNGLV